MLGEFVIQASRHSVLRSAGDDDGSVERVQGTAAPGAGEGPGGDVAGF